MEAVKRLFISLLVLLGCTAGAWAIEQDSDDYYLIGSVQDWKDFASIIATTNSVNAKMTADVDLGDDQTNIRGFGGIFDGQGHTLTINYSSSSYGITPFHDTSGATIKNLHVDGSIKSTYGRESHLSGVIGRSRGKDTITNVWVSVNMTSAGGGWLECAAFIGCNNRGDSSISDCLFTGSITTTSGSYNGCFMGYSDNGTVTISNCLSTGSFSYVGGGNAFRGNHTNCYVSSFPASFSSGVSEATADGLADGSIATALGDAWVQDPGTGQPMLKTFATLKQDDDGYYLIGSVVDWKRFAAIVNDGTDPAANAKMIADVDLGDDQTMVGSESVPYQGTFDGDGNKLTIAYDVTENYVAPFRVVNGTTIQNLEVDGTINTTAEYAGGIIGYSPSSSTASNVTMCRSSVSIVGHSSLSDRTDWHGGFVGLVYTPVHFTDCLSDGKITGSSSPARSYCTGFIGLARGGTSIFTNCLNNCELDVYATNGLWHFIGGTGSVTNSYVNNTISYTAGYSQAAPVSGEQLSNGTVTAMLQNNREEDVWVQDPELGIPMLKIFASPKEEYFLIGSVQDWKDFAALVETTPDINGKLTADVDLGDDQTMVGSMAAPYQGIFDGQGYTLTVNYDMNLTTSAVAPFTVVGDAVIQKLHVAGSIKQQYCAAGGVVGSIMGNVTIKECWVSAYMYVQGSGNLQGTIGGIASCCDNSNARDCSILIEDCVFSGEMATGYHCGSIMSHVNGGYGNSAIIKNCLSIGTYASAIGSTGTFIRVGTQGDPYSIENCYFKTSWGAVQGTQATETQLSDGTTATALQASRSEEIWVQDPVLGTPMLKIFAKTEEDNPVTDLSATTTANTYIVSAAGKYKFKATVKGNGGLDPLTGTIATPIDPASIAGVKVLWELGDTYGRAIKYEDSAYDISYSDGYVYFSTPNSFTTGVACVAIYDSSDNILWSWDIWSTPEPGTATYNGNTFMDRNLCAVDLNNNRGFLYQWGRKDAFSAATGSYASFTFVPTLFTAFNTITGIQTIDYCIKHPTTHVNNGDANSWMSREEYEKLPWRDDIKTIYDPCPAGWRVPTAAEQNGYSGLPGTGFSNAINEFGNPGSGYYRSSTISSYPRAYAFRQNGQQNNWGTNPAFAIRPVKEGIYFIYTVPASGLGTFSAAENVIIPAGLTAYYCTTLKTYEDGKLGVRVFRLNGIIPANTGVLLEGSAGQSYPLTATTVEAAAPAENSLVAVVESEHIPATNGEYTNFMMKGGKFIKIQQDDEGVKMPANRAYLPLLTSAISGSNAKEIMLYWDDEEATGIESLTPGPSPKGEGSIYNLNGQKLSAPQKGINIINGRKVIVK